MMVDYISRQAAIDAVGGMLRRKFGIGGDLAEITLAGLPSAQQWIPCSERLPKECEEVLITWTNTNPESYYADIKGVPFTGSGLYFRGRWFWYSVSCKDYLQEYGYSIGDEVDADIKIIAWMPLPEPYKEEKDGH
jgi:hypothetical protein